MTDRCYRLLRNLLFVALFVGGLRLLCGILAIGDGILREERKRNENAAHPVEISLKDWLERGDSGNRHIQLTHFTFCKHYTVIHHKPSGRASINCIPIVPNDEVPEGEIEPHPPAVRMIVMIGSVSTIAEARQRVPLHGFVGKFDDLHKHDKDKILKDYPATDPSTCQVFRYHDRPRTVAEIERMRIDAHREIEVGSLVVGPALVLLLILWSLRRGR